MYRCRGDRARSVGILYVRITSWTLLCTIVGRCVYAYTAPDFIIRHAAGAVRTPHEHNAMTCACVQDVYKYVVQYMHVCIRTLHGHTDKSCYRATRNRVCGTKTQRSSRVSYITIWYLSRMRVHQSPIATHATTHDVRRAQVASFPQRRKLQCKQYTRRHYIIRP